MSASRAAGHPVRLTRTSSIADGLLPLRPGDLTFAHVQAFVDDVVTVDDAAIADAVRWLYREARVTAEPSGAASVAAVLRGPAKAGPYVQPDQMVRRVRLQPDQIAADLAVAVVSGGNVSPKDFASYTADASMRVT